MGRKDIQAGSELGGFGATLLICLSALTLMVLMGCDDRKLRSIKNGIESVGEHGERIEEAAQPQ